MVSDVQTKFKCTNNVFFFCCCRYLYAHCRNLIFIPFLKGKKMISCLLLLNYEHEHFRLSGVWPSVHPFVYPSVRIEPFLRSSVRSPESVPPGRVPAVRPSSIRPTSFPPVHPCVRPSVRLAFYMSLSRPSMAWLGIVWDPCRFARLKQQWCHLQSASTCRLQS